MTSYLDSVSIAASGQFVPDDDVANLAHLVGLGLLAVGLEVQDSLHALMDEQEIAATNGLLESEPPKQVAQFVETDGSIRRAAKDPQEKSVVLAHAASLPQRPTDTSTRPRTTARPATRTHHHRLTTA